jgi:hypothetical protein
MDLNYGTDLVRCKIDLPYLKKYIDHQRFGILIYELMLSKNAVKKC